MSATFSLTGTSRTDEGKGASRRLRHAQQMPAVIYGAGKPAQSITLPFKDVVKALESEAFYSHILTLTIDGQAQQAVLKALQRHPAKNQPLHADFLRVDAEHKITMRVPLHYVNLETCVGVKSEGGAISIMSNDVEISCGKAPAAEQDMIEAALDAAEALSDDMIAGNLAAAMNKLNGFKA
jgi:large subunit ribosomal protein L25